MKAKRFRPAVAAILLLAAAVTASALDLEGTYAVRGTNPGGQGEYRGEVVITGNGDTYRVVWSVGTAYVGTGVVLDNVLAVAYVDETQAAVGIVAYRIFEGGDRLEGIWCPLGSSILGTETMEKE
jgi:hypothetical protein